MWKTAQLSYISTKKRIKQADETESDGGAVLDGFWEEHTKEEIFKCR